MTQIRDMLYVKSVERILNRVLTEEELNGEGFKARLPNGDSQYFQVPHLDFPYDLITQAKDLIRDTSDETLRYVSPFRQYEEFYFEKAAILEESNEAS